MNKERYVLMAFALAWLFIGCDKPHRADDSAGKGRPSEDEVSSPAQPVGLRSAVCIDGEAGDWENVAPLWLEAGLSAQGSTPEGGVDVKEVYVSNDSDYLYIMMRTVPSVSERFKKDPATGGVCDLFLDIDSNPKTGCANAWVMGYGELDGYEFKIWITLGVWYEKGRRWPFVIYKVYRSNKDKFSEDIAKASSIGDEGDKRLIAHGKDGIELAIPLRHLEVQSGQVVRILLSEDAHIHEKGGHSIRVFTLN